MSYDKAKYHYGVDDFPEELPVTQGGVHMAFFYCWMLEKGFAGEDLLEDGADLLVKIHQETEDYSVLDLLFDFNYGGLMDEDFNQEGAEFADAYYDDTSVFSKKYGSYLQDYSGLDLDLLEGAKEQRYYYIQFSDQNYEKAKGLLDQRYQQFLEFQGN
ncbi:DUF7832 domain-containing protein [Commensalibacter communis]